MKISYNWLKRYIDTGSTPEEIAALLTSCGIEAEEISKFESIPGGLQHVVIGQVMEKEKHPDADKLSVTKVNIGNEILQIVCGAPNVAAGQKVVVALTGAELHFSSGEKVIIKKSKIRGVESNGMICAEDELGLGDSHDGIMILPDTTKTGSSAAEYFNIVNDFIFDINLTPNRGDAYNHLGVARDLKAVYTQRSGNDVSFNSPDLSGVKIADTACPVNVFVESDNCIRYSGVFIKNITVSTSPEWLLNCMKSIGVKPVNNIVDITNFILHEYGQPLHAFDADKIDESTIVAKHLPDETPFITLDGTEVKLMNTDLMICDRNKPLCIAGVYGGLNSGISADTKNIFIESACFDPASVRKTASRLNLRTEAAMHFEKGTDPSGTIEALKRALQLITEQTGGVVEGGIADIYPSPITKNNINIKYKNVDRLIGKKIERETIIQILNSLDIETENITEDGFTAIVPTRKTEVTREADIIEEILRIYGFDLIDPPSDIYSSVSYRDKTDKNKVEAETAAYLVSNGFYEMMTNPISQSGYYSEDNKTLVHLANSMTSELDVMRQTMLFGGLESVAYNLNRKNNKLLFFEFGSTYRMNENGKYKQDLHLVLYLSGIFRDKTWQGDMIRNSFFHIRSFAEKTLELNGINDCVVKEASDENAQFGLQLLYRNKPIATISMANKKLTKRFDIKEDVFYAVINWDDVLQIISTQKIRYRQVTRFPSVKRDLALILDETVSYESIKTTAKKELKNQLLSINLFDLYKGDKIAAGRKSLAVSFTLGDDSKTLTDTDIEKMMNKLIGVFEKEYGAEIRK